VISIHLATPCSQLKIGEALCLIVSIRNDGHHPIWMVGVLDGCEAGIRYPYYRPEVWLGDTLAAEPARLEDPLIGPLRLSDFYWLEPGQSFDPTRASKEHAYLPLITFINFYPRQAGIYCCKLKLDTLSENPEQWLGLFGQDDCREAVLERVLLVPRLQVESNALEVKYT
jgi:hypothetical protein